MQTEHDFFVSYNSTDLDWAEWIAWQLEEAGFKTILQAWDFRPGSNFVLEMQKAAQKARRTVMVLSPDFLNSLYTQPEWTAAFAQDPTGAKGILVPVRVQACNLEGMLAQIIYIDLVGLEEKAAKDRLLKGIERGRLKPVSAPAFPTKGTRTAEKLPQFPGTPRKTNIVLKFSAVLTVILLMIAGIWWLISDSEKEKLRISESEKEKFRVDAEQITKSKTPIQEATGKLFVDGASGEAIISVLNVVDDVSEKAIMWVLNADDRIRQGIELKPGKYHVQVFRDGYETQDRLVELNANEEKRINFELEKAVAKVGRLYVEAIPENAQMRILNINQKFSQGMELKAGSYQLEVSAEGYETQLRWIELKSGHEKPVKFELTKIRVQGPSRLQKVIKNGIGMEFILIQAESFRMGRFDVEIRYPTDFSEEPPHEVKISQPFYLQTTEVSQGQWKKVIGDNPSNFKRCGDDCPVERVSWDDAQRFIEKLNQLEKTKTYRLPSEAEWEYACRSGTNTEYFFSRVGSTSEYYIREDFSKIGEYAWYSNNSKGATHKVATRKSNPWGLYDMYGNVWEWVEDDWHDGYEGAPVNGQAWVDNPRRPTRVVRGGSWYDDARNIQSARRANFGPGFRGDHVGFRLAVSVPTNP